MCISAYSATTPILEMFKLSDTKWYRPMSSKQQKGTSMSAVKWIAYVDFQKRFPNGFVCCSWGAKEHYPNLCRTHLSLVLWFWVIYPCANVKRDIFLGCPKCWKLGANRCHRGKRWSLGLSRFEKRCCTKRSDRLSITSDKFSINMGV